MLSSGAYAPPLTSTQQRHVRHAPILPTVTIDAVGDVMPGWGISVLAQTKGPGEPSRRLRQVLAGADAVVGNLEGPLSDRGTPTKAKPPKALKERKEFLLRGSPAMAPGLASAGFAAMTLANNHILDFGPDALADTLRNLHDSGIATSGAGVNIRQAWAPAYFQRRGVRFALIGISEVIPRGYGASKTTPGVAPGRDPLSGEVNAVYLRTLAHAVRVARNAADVVIVYEHWGRELVGPPSADHVQLAHAAIDAGAAIVLGAHPHVLGPLEAYRGGLIAYSLGNFIFDSRPGIQTQSAILQISLRGGTVASWTAVPVVIRDGVPEPASGAAAAQIRNLLAGTERAMPSERQVVRTTPAAGPSSHGPVP